MSQLISSSIARLFTAVSTSVLCVSLLSCGGGSGSDAISTQQPAPSTPVAPVFKGELSRVAGYIGGPGNLDGIGIGARFNAPQGIALDTVENLYVADTGSGMIRKITPSGTVSTLASIALPLEVATDLAGNVYVLAGDSKAMSIIRINSFGNSELFVDLPLNITYDPYGGCKAGPCGYYSQYTGIATDALGNIYTTQDGKVVRFSPSGQRTTIGTFPKPVKKMAMGSTGTLYAHIGEENEIVKMSSEGNVTTVPVHFRMMVKWDAPNHMIEEPHTVVNLTTAANGNLYILDRMVNGNVQLYAINAAGETFMAGQAPAYDQKNDYKPIDLSRQVGSGMVVSKDNSIFFTRGDTVQKWSTKEVTTFAGLNAVFGHVDSYGFRTEFSSKAKPVAVDGLGNIWVAEPEDFTVRKIVSGIGGDAFTIGNKTQGISDGASPIGSDASFYAPKSIAVGSGGNVYVSDLAYQNDGTNLPLTTIRNISQSGRVSTAFTSTGMTWEVDITKTTWDPVTGPIVSPYVITVDKSGNLYVAETGWGIIRKYALDGTTSIAGYVSREWYGSGQAVFSALSGMVADAQGNLFLLYDSPAEVGYLQATTHRIEKVAPGMKAVLFAGGQTGNTDGKGTEAKFNRPRGITIDDVGNLYVADTGNHSIRKVTPDGTVTTLVGKGFRGNRLGNSPSLDSPTGIAFMSPNALVITVPGAVLKYQ